MTSDPLRPDSPACRSCIAWELLGLVGDWVWETDAELQITRIEPLGCPLSPVWKESLLGVRPWESRLFRPDATQSLATLRRLKRHQAFRELELCYDDHTEGQRWVAISGLPRTADDGQFRGYLGVAVDITQRKMLERSLRQAQADREATLRAVPDLLFEVDAHGVLHDVHAPRPELLLMPVDAIVGRRQSELLPAEALKVIEAALEEALRLGQAHGYRYRLVLRDGLEHWFELSMARKDSVGADVPRCVAVVRDITELKQREAELSTLAFYDALTGLPNRRLLLDRIEQALLRQQRHPAWAVMLFVDIDDFKQVNDQHGHAVGDAALVHVAQSLSRAIRDSDPVGRLSGDEFVALLQEAGDSERLARSAAQRVSRIILNALRQPSQAATVHLPTLSVSIGALVFRGYRSVAELLQRADTLMYRAKQLGKGAFVIERWLGGHAAQGTSPH